MQSELLGSLAVSGKDDRLFARNSPAIFWKT
jgi:hypothetical protein